MNEQLDELDQSILDKVRTMHDLLDPPPGDLNERTKFAIRLSNLDVEVSRLYEDSGFDTVGAGARSIEKIRTVTFETETLTIMMTVTEQGEGLVRVEGWLAPPGPQRVELRVSDTPDGRGVSRYTIPEPSGRFVFDGVAGGWAQLTVYRGPGESVVLTSPLMLG
jgi:hypothetical protein